MASFIRSIGLNLIRNFRPQFMFIDFSALFGEVFFSVGQWALELIYYFELTFWFLAGVNSPTADAPSINFFDLIFSNQGIVNTFWVFLLFSIFLFGVSICIGTIRSQYQKDSTDSLKKVIKSSIMGILSFILMPAMMLTIIFVSGWLINNIAIELAANLLSTSGGADSIAQSIFINSITSSRGQNALRIAIENNRSLAIVGQNSMNVDWFRNTIDLNIRIGGDVNYLLLFITAAVVLYSLVMASVGLVKRLFKIIQLYIFGSWTVATMPLDNGARFEEWRSQFLVQIFQVVGSIAAMFIYLTLVNIAGSELNALATSSASTTTQWVLRLGLLVIIIGGAFALNEGGQLIAGLIQKGAGQAEGMSAMQSNALMKGGLQLATGGLATAAVLAKGAASSASGRGNSLGSMAGSALLGNRGSGNNSGGNNAAMHEMANQSFGGGSNGPSQTAYTGKGGINPQASLSRQQLNLQNIANRSGALSQRQYQKAEKHALRDNYSGTAKSDLQEGQKRTKAEVATSTAGGIRKAAGFVKSHGIIGTMIAAPKKAITAPFNAIKGKAARDKVARMENPKYKSDQARKEFKSLTIQEKSGLSKKDQKHIRNYGFDEKTSVGQKRINEEKALIANSKNDSEDKKKD